MSSLAKEASALAVNLPRNTAVRILRHSRKS